MALALLQDPSNAMINVAPCAALRTCRGRPRPPPPPLWKAVMGKVDHFGFLPPCVQDLVRRLLRESEWGAGMKQACVLPCSSHQEGAAQQTTPSRASDGNASGSSALSVRLFLSLFFLSLFFFLPPYLFFFICLELKDLHGSFPPFCSLRFPLESDPCLLVHAGLQCGKWGPGSSY